MAPFVTGVPGCTCPRCIAFAMPIAPRPAVAIAAAPTAVGGGAGGPAPIPAPTLQPTVPGVAPHEFWDRATPPPIEGFIEGRFAAGPVANQQTVVPPMGTQPGTVTIPPQPVEPTPTVTFPIVPQPEVQIVRVGTPLADVIGFPGNPFLE